MAHSCPNCDQACYCGGDIDDIFFDDGAAACCHCDGEAAEWSDYDDFIDGDETDMKNYELADHDHRLQPGRGRKMGENAGPFCHGESLPPVPRRCGEKPGWKPEPIHGGGVADLGHHLKSAHP